MWLFKIPGNKIFTQQLSNGHAPHSAKLKPSAAWAGHRPLHTSSLGLCCEVPRHGVGEDGLLSFRGISIFWKPTEGSVAYLQKPHLGIRTRPPKRLPSSLTPHSRTRSITNCRNQSNCPTKNRTSVQAHYCFITTFMLQGASSIVRCSSPVLSCRRPHPLGSHGRRQILGGELDGLSHSVQTQTGLERKFWVSAFHAGEFSKWHRADFE